MEYNGFIKLLKYLDDIFYEKKTTETNFQYYGIILDYYFEESVFSIDYLNIEDYFDSNGGFNFERDEYFFQQYKDVNKDKRSKVIENILNILKYSTLNKEHSNKIIDKVINYLIRIDIIVDIEEEKHITINNNAIIDCGSYCNIRAIKKGIVKKELKPIYCNNDKIKKRMKYEYENMKKLQQCPQILNVYEFIEDENAYLMEVADTNLYKYLQGQVSIEFEKKIKIIKDILLGMRFAHENSIIHRDLHLGNILKIKNDFVICDFGLSKDESIQRSLKSSCTEKNNHIFVDPLGRSNFKNLDKKSDIYSIGMLIDYIFTYDTNDSNHIFTFIVEKCTCRDKSQRYECVNEIIKDVEYKLKYRNKQVIKKWCMKK